MLVQACRYRRMAFFFAAGCCDSRSPFFAEKVLKHDFSIKIQIRKHLQ